MGNYSPPPWTHDAAGGQIRDKDGNALASVPIPLALGGIGGDEDAVNGQLMAAAPELAGALEAMFRAVVYDGLTRDQMNERGITHGARLALFKAGGPFEATPVQGMAAALWAIYKLTSFVFNPGPLAVAVSDAAAAGLQAAGIDPQSVWTAEVMPEVAA